MMSGSRLFIFLQDGDHSESWLWPILISLPVPGRPGFSVSKDVALEVSLSGESLLVFSHSCSFFSASVSISEKYGFQFLPHMIEKELKCSSVCGTAVQETPHVELTGH